MVTGRFGEFGRPVDLYKPAGPTNVDNILAYPYTRPRTSFFTDGERVKSLPDDLEQFTEWSDYLLGAAGLPLLADRIPVIAYGANCNPALYSDKMSSYGTYQTILERQTAPQLRAVIPNAVTAWNGAPGQRGNIFAELYRSGVTEGASTVVHVAFLTRNQVAIMHTTENGKYHFEKIGTEVGLEREPLDAYAYVSTDATVLIKDEQPVRVQRLYEAPVSYAMTGEQALDYMLGQLSAGATEALTARRLIRSMAPKALKERKVMQADMAEKLKELGVCRPFSFPSAEPGYRGRANFNFSGSIVQLMETTLEPLRPLNPVRRHGASDIVTEIRKLAHDELAVDLDREPSK